MAIDSTKEVTIANQTLSPKIKKEGMPQGGAENRIDMQLSISAQITAVC
ncbi:MAG: hypothetical protein ACX939_09050 [Hyphococcus sp.]